MCILSASLTPELTKFVEETSRRTGKTKADIMRQALTMYAEESEVKKILVATQEPSLEENLADLSTKVKKTS